MSDPSRPFRAPEASPDDADDEVRALARALRNKLERWPSGCTPCGRELSTETLAELLVLATAVRTLRLNSDNELPQPAPIDESTEDMIDPEFGLLPARTIIMESAESILHGGCAPRAPHRPHHPRRRRRPGERLGDDEG